MAETRPGHSPAGPALHITVTHPSPNEWDAEPPDPQAGAVVQNEGQVIFQGVPQTGCRVYTEPPDAFVDEVHGYEQVTQSNHSFKLASAANNKIITYYICNPGEDCRQNPAKTGPYTIQTGSQTEGGQGS